MITVTICVGSSCHIKGAREMINRFSDFLKDHGLEDKVELKGSFCMERCGEGVNWKIDDEVLSSPSVEQGFEIFQKKIREALCRQIPKRPSKGKRRT